MQRLVLQEENGPVVQWLAKIAILFAIFSISAASLIVSITAFIYVVRH